MTPLYLRFIYLEKPYFQRSVYTRPNTPAKIGACGASWSDLQLKINNKILVNTIVCLLGLVLRNRYERNFKNGRVI